MTVTDAVVTVALRAYEELPAGSGREERMRAALTAVKAILAST